MVVALPATGLVLASVFAVAAMAKLAGGGRSSQTLVAFGAPRRLAGPLGVLLPLAELAGAAAALVSSTTARGGAAGALALLLLSVVAIGAKLVRGHMPDCHCFGPLRSTPASWLTPTRNAALAMTAIFVFWQRPDNGGLSAVGWLGGLTPFQATSLVLGLAVLGLVAAEARLLGQPLGQLDTFGARLSAGGAAAALTGSPARPQLPVGAPARASASRASRTRR